MTSHLPRIHVLGTGGTISYVGEDRLDMVEYTETGLQISVSELLNRIPEARSIAEIDAEQLYEEDDRRLTIGPSQWPTIARRCNVLFATEKDLAGIVITHGSVAVEETAYFLNLTVKDERPVVLTAAQRPITAMGTDGEMNLLDAIRVAASDMSHRKGALLVLNNEIHAAREATKSNTFRLEAFYPRELGFLGYVDADGHVLYYRQPIRAHTYKTEFDVTGVTELPWVEVIFVHSGSDSRLVKALAQAAPPGVVVATMGSGGMPPEMRSATADLARCGTVVVLSSRVGSGRVIQTKRMTQDGFIAADNLTPQKARVLLQLDFSSTTSAGPRPPGRRRGSRRPRAGPGSS